jgi:hypothetical protein
MDDTTRRRLTELLEGLRPLLPLAEQDGVPGRAAARLRAAALEIEEALSPGFAARHGAAEQAIGQGNMDIIRRREHERGAWGIDEA